MRILKCHLPSLSLSDSLPPLSLFLSYMKKQVQDYIAWVNNYLKKRPHASLITDLRSGMQDGITLINLVEIAGPSIIIIHVA